MIFFFSFLLVLFTLFSYAFVDGNFSALSFVYTGFATNQRFLTTIMYMSLVGVLIGFYLFFIKRKDIFTATSLKKLILISVLLLLPAYPAMLSYDIFNYITTAKVTFFYGENPYMTMPVEFANEPYLAFTRAANKVALYGPSWIALTFLPHIAGFQNILATIFSFKIFIALFYLGAVYLIWKISKSIFSVLLFALNPLVLIETLVSGHNDIVTMFFALLAFYFLQKKRIIFAVLALVFSVLIKYATLFLVPVFLFTLLTTMQNKKINWDQIFYASSLSMFVVLLLSPIREELYPWYVIWVLPFVALIPKREIIVSLTLVLSFVALFRYVPVLFTGNYFGTTPLIREAITFIPLSIVVLYWIWKRISGRKSYR